MTASISCQSSTCPNGNPPSKLECPTCSKLGIRGSYFCGQECFKAGCGSSVSAFLTTADGASQGSVHIASHYNAGAGAHLTSSHQQKTHKIIHDLATTGGANLPSDGTYNPFPNFAYTGTMKPVYPLSPRRAVPDHIPRPDYVAAGGQPLSEIKAAGQPPQILNAEEIEKMRTVCRLTREVLDIAAAAVRPGITTDEIDEIVHNATIERNAYPSPLGYRKYPKSVCLSVNEVICHGIPDKRKLKEGDIINIDVSVYYDGVHGDLNATYPVGEIDEESKKLIRTTRESLDEAIKMCKPGALFRDIGKAIEPVARANNCAVVRTYTGHGVNQLFHGAPNIPHYAKNKAVGMMKAGMTFTIEPMLNLGSNWQDVHWPDNWTATTVDGKRSAQFEDTLLITETGVEILTKRQT